ncbi:hypothetical protein [Pantoea agglomerans]|uniref:hypothetical protein n=1 Tax=Enterobacter agglomerans TaxID=549 RepID=UPI003C7CB770
MKLETALITSVIGSLTALIGAFGGAYLANRFAEKRFEKQIEHEKEKDVLKIYREKGEEVLTALSQWNKQLYFVQMGRLAVLSGNKSMEELDELMRTRTEPYTHVKAETLIGIYFPNYSKELAKVFEQITVSNVMFESYSSPGAGKEMGLKKLGKQAATAEESLDKLIEDIRIYILSKYM